MGVKVPQATKMQEFERKKTMSTKKITEALTWNAIREHYYIGSVRTADGKYVKVNNLQDAIDNGELLDEVKACAAKFHSGDLYAVLTQLSKNLSSQKTNMKKKAYDPNKDSEEIRWQLLRSFVDTQMSLCKSSVRNGSSSAYWSWSIEEIDAAGDDIKTLSSVYNNMASRKSKYPEQIGDMDEFCARMKYVSKKLSAVKKKASTPTIDSSTIAKLSKGTKASLSAEEALQLAKLLESLGK